MPVNLDQLRCSEPCAADVAVVDQLDVADPGLQSTLTPVFHSTPKQTASISEGQPGASGEVSVEYRDNRLLLTLEQTFAAQEELLNEALVLSKDTSVLQNPDVRTPVEVHKSKISATLSLVRVTEVGEEVDGLGNNQGVINSSGTSFVGFKESETRKNKNLEILEDIKTLIQSARKLVAERQNRSVDLRRGLYSRGENSSVYSSLVNTPEAAEVSDVLTPLPRAVECLTPKRALRSRGRVLDLPNVQPKILEYNKPRTNKE